MRDARITPIYEGTNGIQAIDLVTRKLKLSDGAALRREIEDMRLILDQAQGLGDFSPASEAVQAFDAASRYLFDADTGTLLAGATPYLRLFALARGATLLIKGAAYGDPRRLAIARFFADNIAVAAPGLARVVTGGGRRCSTARQPLLLELYCAGPQFGELPGVILLQGRFEV